MSFDAGFIARVKDAAQPELSSLAEAAGYRPTRIARRFHCGFCKDSTPSAWLYGDRIHSFCCQQTLDVIDLERLAGGGQAVDAIRRLAVRYGIDAGEIAIHSRPRHTQNDLAHGELLRIGLRWRIERALEATKAELHGPRHKEAATVTRSLTAHLQLIHGWTSSEAVDAGARLDSGLAQSCIEEARDAQMQLAALVLAMGAAERPNEAAA